MRTTAPAWSSDSTGPFGAVMRGDRTRFRVRRAGRIGPAATLLEATIPAGSPLAGTVPRDGILPPGGSVVSVARRREAIDPRAGTRLEAGVAVTILVSPATEEKARALGGSGTPAPA